ncbi:MAG: site-2 protease family protein [Alishewanella aestuarii]
MKLHPLKSNLEFKSDNEAGIALYDPDRGQHYRFPTPALRVLQLCDGKKSALEIAQLAFPDAEPVQKSDQIIKLYQKAAELGLTTDDSLIATRPAGRAIRNPLLWTLAEHKFSSQAQIRLQRLNIFFGRSGWLFLLLIAGAVGLTLFNLPHYYQMMQVFWQFSFWPETAVLIVLTLIFHECGHLAAALRYGSKKIKAGMGLFMLIPVAFVSILDFRCIDSRRSRIIIALAGSYFDLISFSCCVLVFFFTEHFSAANQISLVLSAILLTRIAIDMLPFLRLDGYLALSEWLGRPKLREQACAAALRHIPLIRRYWPSATTQEPRYLPIYGLVSLLFLLFAAVGIFRLWSVQLASYLPQLPAMVSQLIGIALAANLLLMLLRDILQSRRG